MKIVAFETDDEVLQAGIGKGRRIPGNRFGGGVRPLRRGEPMQRRNGITPVIAS